MMKKSTRVSVSWMLCGVMLVMTHGVYAMMADKATGIAFRPKLKDDALTLFGVGVRRKGPIKVYAVGLYSNQTLKEELATVSRASDPNGQQALTMLRKGVKEHPTSFLLEMNFQVSAEKMAKAIGESVAPRYAGSPEHIEKLKGLIRKGVGATKGSVGRGNNIQFDCSPEGIAVAVDGKEQGNVPNTDLAAAFCDVYLDEKSVTPTLRDSCIHECCAP